MHPLHVTLHSSCFVRDLLKCVNRIIAERRVSWSHHHQKTTFSEMGRIYAALPVNPITANIPYLLKHIQEQRVKDRPPKEMQILQTLRNLLLGFCGQSNYNYHVLFCCLHFIDWLLLNEHSGDQEEQDVYYIIAVLTYFNPETYSPVTYEKSGLYLQDLIVCIACAQADTLLEDCAKTIESVVETLNADTKQRGKVCHSLL